MEYYGAPSSQFLPRGLFLLLLSVSMGAVSIPLLLFIHRPFWLIWVLVGCLVIGIIHLISVRSRQARPLTNLEKSLLVFAVLFVGSAVALVVVIGFLPARLLSLALGSDSISVRILWFIGVANACFFLLGGLITVAQTLLEALFPKTGVGNAPLFPGFTWRKVALPGLLGVLAIVLLGLAASFGWSYAYVVMIVVLMILSAPVSTGGKTR